MMPLEIKERKNFILRSNRKVAGEWLVYQRSALPTPCPWVSNKELDALIDHTKGTGSIQVRNTPEKGLEVIRCGRLPEGVTPLAVLRAIFDLDG
jgi:hypothetical protein